MKKKFYVISIFVLGFCCFIISCTHHPDITINDKTYSVVSNTQLNDSVQYYEVVQKSVADAATETYVKTSSGYTKTVFTLNELKAFFQSGKISSLGKESTVDLKVGANILHLQYIDKGADKVFFAVGKDNVLLSDYAGTIANLAKAMDINTGGGPGYLKTCAECNAELKDCEDKIGKGTGWFPEAQCVLFYFQCEGGNRVCPDSASISISFIQYMLPTLNLKVTL